MNCGATWQDMSQTGHEELELRQGVALDGLHGQAVAVANAAARRFFYRLPDRKAGQERLSVSRSFLAEVPDVVPRRCVFPLTFDRRSLLFVRASWSQLLQTPRLVDAKYDAWRLTERKTVGPRPHSHSACLRGWPYDT